MEFHNVEVEVDRPTEGAVRRGLPATALALGVACAIQAAAGSPTPDAPGPAEAGIALALLVAFGPAACLALVAGRSPGPPADLRLAPLAAVAPAAFAILVWPPLAVGLLFGWRTVDILRDLAGLAFLFLPVLALSAPASARRALLAWTQAGLLAIGVGFAVRFLAVVLPADPSPGYAAWADGMRYFPADPAVLFAAVLLPLRAAETLARPGGPRRLAGALGLVLLAAPCLLVIGMTVQRGAVAVGMLTAAAYLVVPGPPMRARLALVVMAGVAAAVAGRWMLAVLTAVAQKTAAVGANGRWEELRLALDAAGSWPGAALVGRGWGALVDLPAVDDGPVSYLHVLGLYLLVKTGLVGLAAGAALLGSVARAWPLAFRADPAAALAAAAAAGLAGSVHTGFKTLSFGLILSTIVFRASTR